MVEDYGIVVWVVGLKVWSLEVYSVQHTPYTRVMRLPWLRCLDYCCCSLLRPRSTSRFVVEGLVDSTRPCIGRKPYI